jgi:hypothetical protein
MVKKKLRGGERVKDNKKNKKQERKEKLKYCTGRRERVKVP